MATTTYHMCIDIAGVLRWPDRYLEGMVKHEDGSRMLNGKECRDWLKVQLAQGKRVLPMGNCKGFNFQTGCPGHRAKEEENP